MNKVVVEPKLVPKDFKSDQDVRWCPGCGDYSILAVMQRALPHFETQKHNYAFVSGIGCASRFPYYMNTYGFHTIHGRALSVSLGLKIANPKLEVWVISGDGDSLSIGGNHLIHAARRNINLKLIIFNNRIYGLTKGQYSPTSEVGKVTKSTPLGSLDHPFNPSSLILGAEASFYARTLDRETKHLQEMITRAHHHKGFAVIEVFQNCNVFNDGAFQNLTAKETKSDHRVLLEHGQPLIFGSNSDQGVRLNGLHPEVFSVEESNRGEALVHDEKDPILAAILARLGPQIQTPLPLGVLHAVERPTYDQSFVEQMEKLERKKGLEDLNNLLHSGSTWSVS